MQERAREGGRETVGKKERRREGGRSRVAERKGKRITKKLMPQTGVGSLSASARCMHCKKAKQKANNDTAKTSSKAHRKFRSHHLDRTSWNQKTNLIAESPDSSTLVWCRGAHELWSDADEVALAICVITAAALQGFRIYWYARSTG